MKHTYPLFILVIFLTLSPINWASNELQQQINELDLTIEEKKQSRDSFSQNNNANNVKTRELNSEILSLEIEIKQLDREERKINVLSGGQLSENDKGLIHKINYKRRVAEINLQKNQAQLEKLEQEQVSSSKRITRLNKLIAEMESEMLVLKKTYSTVALKKSQQLKLQRDRKQAQKRQQRKAREKQLKAAALQAKKKAIQEAQVKKDLEKKTLEQKELEKETQEILLSKLPPKTKIAFNKTKSRANKKTSDKATLGVDAVLEVSNPIGSPAKTAAKMEHLGNNQYVATIKANQGKQHYIIAGYKFTQNIPKHLDDSYYLIMIDARKTRPIFEMMSIGR